MTSSQKEAATLAVLETYLPEQIDPAELSRLIDQALSETGAQGVRDMGKVMAWLKPHVQGRADMGAVSAKIKRKITRLTSLNRTAVDLRPAEIRFDGTEIRYTAERSAPRAPSPDAPLPAESARKSQAL